MHDGIYVNRTFNCCYCSSIYVRACDVMIVWSLWQCSHLECRVQLYCRVRHSLYYIAAVLLGCVLLTATLQAE